MRSDNRIPHVAEKDGRKILYVEGLPFIALSAEIPWWDLEYGRYDETLEAYDQLYAAAKGTMMYGIDQSRRTVNVTLDDPMVVRILYSTAGIQTMKGDASP